MLINKHINIIVITILETWFSNDDLHLHLKSSDNHAIINEICGFMMDKVLCIYYGLVIKSIKYI